MQHEVRIKGWGTYRILMILSNSSLSSALSNFGILDKCIDMHAWIWQDLIIWLGSSQSRIWSSVEALNLEDPLYDLWLVIFIYYCYC